MELRITLSLPATLQPAFNTAVCFNADLPKDLQIHQNRKRRAWFKGADGIFKRN